MWPQMVRNMFGQGVAQAGSQAGGEQIQSTFGGQQPEGPAPQEGRTASTTPLLEQYNREQQSNSAYPPGQSFMGLPFWGAGNMTARLPGVTGQTLQPAVETFSDPSNSSSTQNRSLLGQGMSMLGVAASTAAPALMRSNRWVGGAALVGGTAMNMLGGVITGSERVAQQQASTVPRQPVPQPLQDMTQQQRREGYQQVSQDYTNNGFAPQGSVTSVLNPTPQNAFISQTIHDRLRGTPSFQPPSQTPSQSAEDRA